MKIKDTNLWDTANNAQKKNRIHFYINKNNENKSI